jgi:hypothetical protein
MNIRMKTAGVAVAIGGALAMGVMIGHAAADQPHMQSALSELQSARGELMAADNDKGGYRARAIRDVDAAIADTRAGMNWAGGHRRWH